MKSKQIALILAVACVGVVLLVSGLVEAESAAPTSLSTEFFVEYPIPTANSEPLNIIVESPGRVWFTMSNANAIGLLTVNTPSDYAFESFELPNPDSEPFDLATDGTYVWFTERAGNRIGRLEIATGAITEYTIPTANSAPTGIAIAPNGHIWFVQQAGNKVARFNPDGNTFSEFAYGTAGADFLDIDVVRNGLAWITAPGLYRVLFFEESSGDFEVIPVQQVFAGQLYPPNSVVVDDNNRTWISSAAAEGIAFYLPGTLALWRWTDTVGDNWGPTALATSEQNGLIVMWFTEENVGRVAQFGYSGYDLVYRYDMSLPTPNSGPAGIAVDDSGHAWIAERSGNKIAEWRAPYTNLVNLPLINK